MKIAITAYVDHIEKEKYADECNLMTFSGQQLDDRFTFIIFCHPDTVKYIDVYDNVKVIPYHIPDDTYHSIYRFARSLYFVYDMEDLLLGYDYIIKTDTDVLFTPKMNDFPFDNNIYVGLGYYTVKDESLNELQFYAKKFGYDSYKRVSDMHSTIICSSSDMVKIMYESDILCEKMYFGIEEPGEWGSEKLWRGHKNSNSGICSMYALEVVLSSDEYRDRVIVTNKIDAGSSWEMPWTECYHYHCYHHNDIYSKFQAKFGAYENLNMQSGDSSAAYCINTFLKRIKDGKENPEKFVKPFFTKFKIPDDYYGYTIKYEFPKEVD